MSDESRQKRWHNQQQRQLLKVQASQFVGPLPPPEILLKYNEAVPDAAERILVMAEGQFKHRQALESQVIDSNCKAQQRAPLYGLIVCLAAIGGGIYLIRSGHDASGLAAVIAPLAGLVSAFVWGKIKQQQELKSQATALVAPPQPPKA